MRSLQSGATDGAEIGVEKVTATGKVQILKVLE